MEQDLEKITRQLFQKDNIHQLDVSEIEGFLSLYPYTAPARFLLAKKKFEAKTSEQPDEVITAGLYFNNPLWYEWQLKSIEEQQVADKTIIHLGKQDEHLQKRDTSPEQTEQHQQKEDNKLEVKPATIETEPALVFQSYHT